MRKTVQARPYYGMGRRYQPRRPHIYPRKLGGGGTTRGGLLGHEPIYSELARQKGGIENQVWDNDSRLI